MIQSEKLKNKVIESTHQPPYENLLLLDLPGEIWKPFPIEPFDEYYMVSNKGRIKRLAHKVTRIDGIETTVKERILKQVRRRQTNHYLNEDTYALVTKVSFNGKRAGYVVARLVYHAFVEAFDLYDRNLYVRYKDGSGLNCLPENLYLFERSKLTQWLLDHDRKSWLCGASDKSKYSKEEIQQWYDMQKKTVSQYDMKGRLVRVFESRTDAANAIGVSSTVIRAVLRGKIPTAGDFFWREGSENPPCIDVPFVRRPVKIAKYNCEGNLECVFSSIKEAGRSVSLSEKVVADRIYGRASQRNFILKIVEEDREPLLKISTESLNQVKGYDCKKYGIPDGKNYPFQNFSLDDLPGEKWKELPGWNRLYYVSDHGRIKTTDCIVKIDKASYQRSGEILRQSIRKRQGSGQAMLVVTLKINSKATGYQVSTLIYKLFHGKIDCGYTVVYKDQDPFNCKADNLKLESFSIIFKQYYREGKLVSSFDNRRRRVAQYTLEGELIAVYPSLLEAEKNTGISYKKISTCVLGKKNACEGFLWKYL